jgi:hypothetical protein
MTSDAIRQPGDSTRPAAEQAAPGTSEETQSPTDPPTATPAEGSATTGAMAGASNAETPAEAADAVVSAEAAAPAETGTTAEAVTPAETVTTAEAVAATQAAADDTAAVPGPRRRERFATFLRRFVTVAIAVAIFVGGIALGSTIFQMTRPAPAVVPPGQVGTTTEQPALVTQEFIAALRANNFDAMRSSLQAEAAIHFADEIERRGVMSFDKVEVLGTHVAGQRSATEILMQYKNGEDLPLTINLVILVDGGKIEGFR